MRPQNTVQKTEQDVFKRKRSALFKLAPAAGCVAICKTAIRLDFWEAYKGINRKAGVGGDKGGESFCSLIWPGDRVLWVPHLWELDNLWPTDSRNNCPSQRETKIDTEYRVTRIMTHTEHNGSVFVSVQQWDCQSIVRGDPEQFFH